jgi:hypothetical protein
LSRTPPLLHKRDDFPHVDDPGIDLIIVREKQITRHGFTADFLVTARRR